MQLGADTISIEMAGEAYELRPSLRACLRLTHKHGLSALAGAARDFKISIILDMLSEAAIKPALLWAEIASVGLGAVCRRLTEPLSKFVLAVAGIDPDATPEPAISQASGKQLSPDEYHTQLFQIATGWLGWTPEQAWAATSAEIRAARTGRTDLITDILKAVFGTDDKPEQTETSYSPEKLAEIEAAGFDPEFDRAGLAALKAKMQAGA